MQYIIFGAGATGSRAADMLDWGRVEFFADNKAKGHINGKEIVDYDTMIKLVSDGDYIIVVASITYESEMVSQLRKCGISKYFVFRDFNKIYKETFYPSYRFYRKQEYMDYIKVLNNYHISKYKRLAIYGDNLLLPYLISDLSILNDYNNIVGIVQTSDSDSISTVGIPVVKLDDIWDEIDCLIINKRRNESGIYDRLDNKEHKFDIISIYDISKFEPEFHYPSLKKLKNTHQGERCFLIGNGPSLKISDLEKLYQHNEFCIGFNKIYKVYDRTNWRADMIASTDFRSIKGTVKDIEEMKLPFYISDEWHDWIDMKPIDKVMNFHVIRDKYAPNMPDFSDDITSGVFCGWTVMYDFGIQFAVYMGFTRIYIIGADNNNVGQITDKRNHFIEDYYSDNDKKYYDPNEVADFISINLAYKKAEIYSRKHGFRIYNATRGGHLEVFERVDFDSLF